MRERDLNVERHSNGVADHDKDEAIPVGRKSLVDQTVTKPIPEEDLPSNLEPAVPSSSSLPRAFSEDKVLPREAVKIESSKAQDGIIKVVLNGHNDLSKGIVRQNSLVVGGKQVSEKTMADGKERQMLDIGIVLGVVGNNVMNLKSQ